MTEQMPFDTNTTQPKTNPFWRTYNNNKSILQCKNGTGITAHKKRENSFVLRNFNCGLCNWRNTDNCPHGIKDGEHHHNWICSEKVSYIKEQYDSGMNSAAILQRDNIMTLQIISEKLVSEYATKGILDPEFKHITKNLISALDKYRKQEEGINIKADVNIKMDKFWEIINGPKEEAEITSEEEYYAKPISTSEVARELKRADEQQDKPVPE